MPGEPDPHRDDTRASRASRAAAWRSFAGRDWAAIERDTRRARIIAWELAGPQAHHALYLEIAETLLERRSGDPRPPRDEADEATHHAVQMAIRRLEGR